jgi:GTP-binding protein
MNDNSIYPIKKEQAPLKKGHQRSACFFLKSAPVLSALPEQLTPEIAFWGRSNVGKSSLLNVVMQSSSLARVSKTPGCTQAIHFYQCPPGLMLVDLPGYGFAKVPLSLKVKWHTLVTHYLSSRASLWKIYLLIDSRHPLQPADRAALSFLAGTNKQCEIVFTKSDAIPRTLLEHHFSLFTQEFPKLKVSCVSSKKKRGFDPLFEALSVFNPSFNFLSNS